MAAGPSVGAQLKDMISALNRYDQTTASTGPQSTDLSLMTLLWPLLPLLPPEPPLLLSELLRRPEKCDLCGTSQGTALVTRTPKEGRVPTTSSRLRSIHDKTPLDRLMMDIENKLDETLTSIQETVEKNTELGKKASEIQKLQTSDMSDEELLKTLKKLTKEKAEKMEKVNILEVKEQQLKESLMTAIGWAKSVQLRKGKLNDEKVDLRKSIQKNVVFGDSILKNVDQEKTDPEKEDFEGIDAEKVDSEKIITERELFGEDISEKEENEEINTENEESGGSFTVNEDAQDVITDKEKEAIEIRKMRFRGI